MIIIEKIHYYYVTNSVHEPPVIQTRGCVNRHIIERVKSVKDSVPDVIET